MNVQGRFGGKNNRDRSEIIRLLNPRLGSPVSLVRIRPGVSVGTAASVQQINLEYEPNQAGSLINAHESYSTMASYFSFVAESKSAYDALRFRVDAH